MKALETIGGYIDQVAKTLTQVCVAIMAVIVTLQVIFRYFLGNPIFWAEELARYSLVWMTFIGAAVGLRAGLLACMDLLVTRFPAPVQKWIRVLAIALNCALFGFLLYYSIVLVGIPSVTSQKSPAMRLPMSYFYAAMPVGLILLLLQSFILLVETLTGKKGAN